MDDLSSQRCLSKSGSKFVASGASTVAWGGLLDRRIPKWMDLVQWSLNGSIFCLFVLVLSASLLNSTPLKLWVILCVYYFCFGLITGAAMCSLQHEVCPWVCLKNAPPQKKKSNDLKPAFPLWKCPYISGGHPTVSRKLDKLLCHWKPLLSLAFLRFCDQNLIEEMRPWHS